MADLNLSASPSSGGKKPKAFAPKVPTTGIPKLCMNPTGDYSPVSRTAGVIVGAVSVVALALATSLFNPPAPVTQSTGTGTGTTASSVTSIGHTTRVPVGVESIAFIPGRTEVPVGDRLVIDFMSSGDQRHDLVFETGVSSGSLASGEIKELDLGIISGDVGGRRSLPGHRGLGMTPHVQATGASSLSSSSSGISISGSHAYHGHDHGQNAAAGPVTSTALTDYAEAIDTRDPVLPPVTNEAERHYIFTVIERTVSVISSLTRESQTFDGDAPGPILCGCIGDTFHITFVNNGTTSHSPDFYVGPVAPDNVTRSIEPGQMPKYTFVAKDAGIWLCHCLTVPVSTYIANGIPGAVIIDPTYLDKADREYIMVASEFHLGADGQPADTSLLSALQSSAMAFNGVPFRYEAHPTQIKTNKRVRVWVIDAGLNLVTTFHVVGTQLDTVWREGAYVIRGSGSGGGWGQALILGAAEGGFVEFAPLEAGHYTFVNHALPLAEKGQIGVFEVTD